jgi:hypothetical protein
MPATKPFLMAVAGVLLSSTPVLAWPSSLMESLTRDARRLLPKSLAMLVERQEREVLEDAQRLSPELEQALAADLAQGRLSRETLDLVDARGVETVGLLRKGQVSEAIPRLGAVARIAADIADPALNVGETPCPPEVAREYYAFLSENLTKIPVVLEDPAALRLKREGLGAYWQDRLTRTRDDSIVMLGQLYPGGRLVDHRNFDYRSPIYAVASLAYSRAVTAVAAAWIAIWREAKGDMTMMPRLTVVVPREPPTPAPRVVRPSPEADEP